MVAKVLRLRYWRSELFVGQHFSASQILQRRIKHRKLFPATVKSIRKLIAVAAQVLARNFVERAVDAPLEQRECVLNCVAVVSPSPYFFMWLIVR